MSIITNKFQHTHFNLKTLKFSQNLKNKSIAISWNLCLCDQPIPKYGSVVVDFKVKFLQYLTAGICLIPSISNDYFGQSNGFGKGFYFLSEIGCVYSHHDKEKDGKKLDFKYEQNDVISMIVNMQQEQITWRNRSKNQVYTLDIKITFDFYFCFQLCNKSEIELICECII